MKKLLAAVLVLMMCFACACAEGIEQIERTAFETYAASVAEITEEEWEADDIEQIQTLKPEEGVAVSACLDQEGLVCITVEFPCDQATGSVRAAIEKLGWLSFEAIDQMFALEDDATLVAEGYTIYRVHGENRDAFSICLTEDVENIIWQPVHGGEKLHTKVECSGMDVSRMITQEAASLTGWDMCKRCSDVTQETTEEETVAQAD